MDHPELKHTLQRFFPGLKGETLDSFSNFCAYKRAAKHTALLSEGEFHPYSYIILQGSAKAYYLKDGKEVCNWFAFENEPIGSMATFQGLPSNETIVLLEDAQLVQIQLQEFKELAERDLATSRLLNDLFLEQMVYTEERLRQLQFMTAQERYAALLEKEPGVLQRVSLTDIASYLGVSRETLSRIRAMK